MVYIREGNDIFYNNTVDVISLHEYLYTTKKSSFGRYYFEFAHIEGPYCHLAGFDFGGRKIFAYPYCLKDICLSQAIYNKNYFLIFNKWSESKFTNGTRWIVWFTVT